MRLAQPRATLYRLYLLMYLIRQLAHLDLTCLRQLHNPSKSQSTKLSMMAVLQFCRINYRELRLVDQSSLMLKAAPRIWRWTPYSMSMVCQKASRISSDTGLKTWSATLAGVQNHLWYLQSDQRHLRSQFTPAQLQLRSPCNSVEALIMEESQ